MKGQPLVLSELLRNYVKSSGECYLIQRHHRCEISMKIELDVNLSWSSSKVTSIHIMNLSADCTLICQKVSFGSLFAPSALTKVLFVL